MPSIKLTKRTIDAINPPDRGQVFYRDSDLPGFGLRVGTQSKVFFAEGQSGGEPSASASVDMAF